MCGHIVIQGSKILVVWHMARHINLRNCKLFPLFLSDSSGELHHHRNPSMIALQRMAHPHRDPALSQVELKTEPNMGLPDPSILPSKYYEDEDDVMSSTDSDEHSSSSEKKKRPGRKKGQSKLIYTYVVKRDFKCQFFKNSTKYFIFFYFFFNLDV